MYFFGQSKGMCFYDWNWPQNKTSTDKQLISTHWRTQKSRWQTEKKKLYRASKGKALLLLYNGRKWKSPPSFPSSVIPWISWLIPCHKIKKEEKYKHQGSEPQMRGLIHTHSLLLFSLRLWDKYTFFFNLLKKIV